MPRMTYWDLSLAQSKVKMVELCSGYKIRVNITDTPFLRFILREESGCYTGYQMISMKPMKPIKKLKHFVFIGDNVNNVL